MSWHGLTAYAIVGFLIAWPGWTGAVQAWRRDREVWWLGIGAVLGSMLIMLAFYWMVVNW